MKKRLSDLKEVTARHEQALWKVEQLWAKMPKRDYKVRTHLVTAAVELSKIAEEIKKIGTMKAKKI